MLQGGKGKIGVSVQPSLLAGSYPSCKHVATLIEFRRKVAVVRDHATGQYWVIPYAAINLEGADVRIRESRIEPS